jgi:hypothetical protein
VADILGEDRLELGAVRRVRVASREALRRHRYVGNRGGRVVENVRPLLDLLEEVLGVLWDGQRPSWSSDTAINSPHQCRISGCNDARSSDFGNAHAGA